MIDRINALVLPVRDVKLCADFYRDKLGFSLDQLETNEAYLTIGANAPVLALKSIDLVAKEISVEKIRPKEVTINRTHYVVFVVSVHKEYGDLRQKGVHFVNSPATKSDGWRTVHFEDPEGNLWEISERPKK